MYTTERTMTTTSTTTKMTEIATLAIESLNNGVYYAYSIINNDNNDAHLE